MWIDQLKHSLYHNGDQKAIYCNGSYYTYNDLLKATSRIYNRLIVESVAGLRVALIANNDFETYAAILAIWFSKGAYIPLGIHNPVERNLGILMEAGVSTLLSSTTLDEEDYVGYRIINTSGEATPEVHADFSLVTPDPGRLSYVLFTSGSTGIPKGVPITYGNIQTFLNNFLSTEFSISRDDRCLQMFELTFDVSISSFLVPLLKGACIYLVPNNVIKYTYVIRLLQEHQLTSIQIVPSIIRMNKKFLNALRLPSVRNCILTGEATMIDLVEAWSRCIPNAKIFNYYGPTEATIYCSWYKYNPADAKEYNGMLAIGQPLGNVKLAIVTEDHHLAKVGEKGELYIGGDQLTEGYLNMPEKTKASFVAMMYENEPEFFYKSGDICYVDQDGIIHYCGRNDNQVKLQGFRVELGEIENVVRKKFNLSSVVIPTQNKVGLTELILVVENSNGSHNDIISYLRQVLPDYMVPVRKIELEEFPVTASGKTNRSLIKDQILCGELR